MGHTKEMSKLDILKTIEANPEASAATGGAAIWGANQLFFDPYRNCSIFMTTISLLFTFGITTGIPIALFQIDWHDHVNFAVEMFVKLAGGMATLLGGLAVYKKSARVIRKRRINKERERR